MTLFCFIPHTYAYYGRPALHMRTLYFCPVVSSSFFFFFAYSQPSQIGCLPYFHTWCGLSANLGCMSETCCMRLAENTGRKKIAKNSPAVHHRTTLSGYIFATKACIDNRKNFLNSNISSICPHNMANFGPLTAEISSGVWGTPAHFNGIRVYSLRYCSDVAHRIGLPTKLCTMFGRLPGWYTIYTFSGLLPPNGILPVAKFTLRPSLAFSYIGSVTARHSSNGREPNFSSWYKDFIEGATYIRHGGYHVGHWRTF